MLCAAVAGKPAGGWQHYIPQLGFFCATLPVCWGAPWDCIRPDARGCHIFGHHDRMLPSYIHTLPAEPATASDNGDLLSVCHGAPFTRGGTFCTFAFVLLRHPGWAGQAPPSDRLHARGDHAVATYAGRGRAVTIRGSCMQGPRMWPPVRRPWRHVADRRPPSFCVWGDGWLGAWPSPCLGCSRAIGLCAHSSGDDHTQLCVHVGASIKCSVSSLRVGVTLA